MFYTEKYWALDEPASLAVTSEGPLCLQITVNRSFMHSRMTQDIRFYAHSPRIDFNTWVDWKEHQYLLKAGFPVDVHTDEAAFDIQFGNVVRKTHTNTSWDRARFESCGHKWMDVSESGYGVSLLNDCKYGHSVREGCIEPVSYTHLYPVLVTAGCVLIFREGITIKKVLALLCGAAGTVLFLEHFSAATGSGTGIFLALLSGLFYSLHMVVMDKSGLKNMHYFKLSFYLSLIHI